jgi:hypothetical protein
MDPIVRDNAIAQMAERNVQRYRDEAAPTATLYFFISYILGVPFFLWFFWTITHMEWAYKH